MKFFISALFFCLYKSQANYVVAYFPGYNKNYTVDQFDMKKLTHVVYAFAIPNSKGEGKYKGSYFSEDQDKKLKDLVQKAHQKNPKVNVLVSIGGYTGSKYMSDLVKDKHKAQFTHSLIKLMNDYKLDGIDIDWEYPGLDGMKCNHIDGLNDSDNYLKFLKNLREELNKNGESKSKKFLTAAVHIKPFTKNKETISNNKEFSNYFDFVMIMAYDINGKWSPYPGANAPTNGPGLSFESSIKLWTDTGFPKEKIVMGLSFYGRSVLTEGIMKDGTTNLKNAKVNKMELMGDKDDIKEPLDPEVCNDKEDQEDLTDVNTDKSLNAKKEFSGIWKYKNIVSQILKNQTQTDWKINWDEESKTPWFFKKGDKYDTFLSFDDPKSIAIKSKIVRNNKLGGIMFWTLEQDNGELKEAALKGIFGDSYGNTAPESNKCLV